MKKILITLVLTAATLVACNKSDDSGGGSSNNNSGDYAATPQPCNGTTSSPNCYYNNNQYPYNQQYPYQGQNFCWPSYGGNCSYGGWQFPTTYNPGNGNCGCNSGYMPVYGGWQGGFGYACAPYQNYAQYNRIMYFGQFGQYGRYGQFGFSWWSTGQNDRWLNNYQTAYNGGNSCASSTAQGCDVRLNNCPGGYRCQPVGGGSTIGLCAR